MATPPASHSSGRSTPDASAAAASSRPRRTFRAAQRVTASAAFQSALKHGARASDDLIRIWVARNALDSTRLGLVIGRRHGNAVQRNRLKRLLREAFRTVRINLPVGLDVLCSPHTGVAPTLAALRESLPRLAPLAEKRLRN
jgi:ribonuclease P protein component